MLDSDSHIDSSVVFTVKAAVPSFIMHAYSYDIQRSIVKPFPRVTLTEHLALYGVIYDKKTPRLPVACRRGKTYYIKYGDKQILGDFSVAVITA